jgi:hypothetical protein
MKKKVTKLKGAYYRGEKGVKEFGAAGAAL